MKLRSYSYATPYHKVPLIIDTDASADVDDVVAICLAHKLQDRGEADILAIVHDAGLPGMNKTLTLGSAASRVTSRFRKSRVSRDIF